MEARLVCILVEVFHFPGVSLRRSAPSFLVRVRHYDYFIIMNYMTLHLIWVVCGCGTKFNASRLIGRWLHNRYFSNSVRQNKNFQFRSSRDSQWNSFKISWGLTPHLARLSVLVLNRSRSLHTYTISSNSIIHKISLKLVLALVLTDTFLNRLRWWFRLVVVRSIDVTIVLELIFLLYLVPVLLIIYSVVITPRKVYLS
jgi:hypothetical protein